MTVIPIRLVTDDCDFCPTLEERLDGSDRPSKLIGLCPAIPIRPDELHHRLVWCSVFRFPASAAWFSGYCDFATPPFFNK
jgi:hypothetical protein